MRNGELARKSLNDHMNSAVLLQGLYGVIRGYTGVIRGLYGVIRGYTGVIRGLYAMLLQGLYGVIRG